MRGLFSKKLVFHHQTSISNVMLIADSTNSELFIKFSLDTWLFHCWVCNDVIIANTKANKIGSDGTSFLVKRLLRKKNWWWFASFLVIRRLLLSNHLSSYYSIIAHYIYRRAHTSLSRRPHQKPCAHLKNYHTKLIIYLRRNEHTKI